MPLEAISLSTIALVARRKLPFARESNIRRLLAMSGFIMMTAVMNRNLTLPGYSRE
ncbi:hypothetical protein CNE_BB1p09230 (plasmid) [Cupriavidus necator N-1]|uniref:Uncharacterized protein n=1 Tax=Cupriavidus necator (strain ATCC 43291 / DSM 13513 / CCUG 52238 / LMG 8453 / N-1) TaxID=1042878 RepID=F8GUD1_CUPNN|nr:hypothetical protein CNE_BB1p09230 [Cupriavidus necator N-1]